MANGLCYKHLFWLCGLGLEFDILSYGSSGQCLPCSFSRLLGLPSWVSSIRRLIHEILSHKSLFTLMAHFVGTMRLLISEQHSHRCSLVTSVGGLALQPTILPFGMDGVLTEGKQVNCWSVFGWRRWLNMRNQKRPADRYQFVASRNFPFRIVVGPH